MSEDLADSQRVGNDETAPERGGLGAVARQVGFGRIVHVIEALPFQAREHVLYVGNIVKKTHEAHDPRRGERNGLNIAMGSDGVEEDTFCPRVRGRNVQPVGLHLGLLIEVSRNVGDVVLVLKFCCLVDIGACFFLVRS